jgi:hypothetical protein
VYILHVVEVSPHQHQVSLGTGEAQSGHKRKLNEEETTTCMGADSCASSHASLGTGIILHVQSEIMTLLEKTDIAVMGT